MHKPYPRFLFLLALLIAGLALASDPGASVEEPASDPAPGSRTNWRHEIDGYVIEASWDADMLGQSLVVRRGEMRHLLLQGFRFTLGVPTRDSAGWGWAAMPEHFNEQGRARILVHESYGSATIDCSTIHVIELCRDLERDTVLLRQSLGAGAGSVWSDLDADGELECTLFDGAFLYWCANRADTIMPRVVLDDRGHGYQPAPGLMLRPPPSAEDLDRWLHPDCFVGSFYTDYSTDPPTRMLHKRGCATMLNADRVIELIYSGNEDAAWSYYAQARSETEPSVEALRTEIEDRIRSSAHWPAVLAVNALGRERRAQGLPAGLDPPIGPALQAQPD